MSYDKVQALRIVKREDGYSFKGRFAASNVFPIYYESSESYKCWPTRDEVDTELAWQFWNGNFQGGQTEWAVREDIARLFHARAGVKDLPVREWDGFTKTHKYGTSIPIMENIIFPAARDVYLRWKTTPGKFAFADDEAFVMRTRTVKHGGTSITRCSRPVFFDAKKAGMMSAKIANAFGCERFRRVSDMDFEAAKSELQHELGSDYVPHYKLAKRCFDISPKLFESEWNYAVERFPDINLCRGENPPIIC